METFLADAILIADTFLLVFPFPIRMPVWVRAVLGVAGFTLWLFGPEVKHGLGIP